MEEPGKLSAPNVLCKLRMSCSQHTGAAHARHENIQDDMDGVPIVDFHNLSWIERTDLLSLRIVHPTRDGLLGVLDGVLYRELRSIVRVGLRGCEHAFHKVYGESARSQRHPRQRL